MSNPDGLAPQPRISNGATSAHTLPLRSRGYRYWFGMTFTLLGDVLLIAALFSPWIEVFKQDPSLPIPKRGYSPWMMLQQGPSNSLFVPTAVFFALVLGFVILTIMLVSTAGTRGGIIYVIAVLAFVGLLIIILALWAIPFDLSLNYPYYDHNTLYGGGLAIAGFLSVLFGVACVVPVR